MNHEHSVRKIRMNPKAVAFALAAVAGLLPTEGRMTGSERSLHEAPIILSDEHIAKISQQRRIMVNNDVGYPAESFLVTPDEWIAARFSLFDEPGSQVDCVSWNLDEGNQAAYPSKILPVVAPPGLIKWLKDGVDIAQAIVGASHQRRLEAFWEYRLNGADREADLTTPARVPMKEQHPEWLLKDSWWKPAFWNYAVPEVRAYKVAILREVMENYDYDGLTLDFGRHPPHLPVGEQWLNRDAMTDFVRQVRLMLQGVSQHRGRPILLAVRVASTPAGCHYDGLFVEEWARQRLVDIMIMGVRSADVDVAGFRRLTAGTPIKLYASVDGHHSTDGYFQPPLEFFRGLAANWWHQGVDGILTFNFANESSKWGPLLGRPPLAQDRQAYHEMGDPKMLAGKDKMFALQRRYGAGWDRFSSEIWDFFQNINHLAPLPLSLPTNGYSVIKPIYIGDDIAAFRGGEVQAELRVQTANLIDVDLLELKFNGVKVTPVRCEQEEWVSQRHERIPGIAAKQVRSEKEGWVAAKLRPEMFALGENLVGFRIRVAPVSAKSAVAQTGVLKSANWKAESRSQVAVTIEKAEVHVRYPSNKP